MAGETCPWLCLGAQQPPQHPHTLRRGQDPGTVKGGEKEQLSKKPYQST